MSGYKWGQRVGRAVLELLGATEVIREMNQQAKRRRGASTKRDGADHRRGGRG